MCFFMSSMSISPEPAISPYMRRMHCSTGISQPSGISSLSMSSSIMLQQYSILPIFSFLQHSGGSSAQHFIGGQVFDNSGSLIIISHLCLHSAPAFHSQDRRLFSSHS